MFKTRFLLKEDHIKLARRMFVYWEPNAYLGAPAIDQKCPYGNSSILQDIAEITGALLFVDKDGDMHMSETQEKYFLELHREMETALQIILATGSFKPGLYEADKYDALSWKLIETE